VFPGFSKFAFTFDLYRYAPASVRVPLTLTSETSWGATRSARGKRLDSEAGGCTAVESSWTHSLKAAWFRSTLERMK
jgi:hypothetical protein